MIVSPRFDSSGKNKPRWIGAFTVMTVMTLAGCGGDDDKSETTHTDTHIESEGRIAVYDAEAQAVKVLSLDNGQTLHSVALPGSTPRLYSSPDYRYSVVIQRDEDRVSFIDGGLYTEDHGDHLHDYAETPQLQSLFLSASKPTHYTVNESGQGNVAIIFFDGSDNAQASISIFSDSSLNVGQELASMGLENRMHGVAKLIDDKVYVTYRDAAITDTTLPAEVERYAFNDGNLQLETRYDTACPRLHGAGYNESMLAFGCSDGLLVVDLTQPELPASKRPNPAELEADSRIGTVYGHHDVADLIGRAGNQFFVVSPSASDDNYPLLSLAEGVSSVAQGFAKEGERFYILGDDGILRLFDPQSDWQEVGQLQVIDPLTAEAVAPSVVASNHNETLILLDPAKQEVVVIDTHELSVHQRFALDFSAQGLAWMGIEDHEQGDDHSHD
ncbi:hypothetical protein [Oleiphilus messinensis]|nr:hypothetical protein [Oleiphilus messinensis]